MYNGVYLVDLGKSFSTNIFLQNLASIQKRTSLLKFVWICLNLFLILCGAKASHHRRQSMWRRHQKLTILDEHLLIYWSLSGAKACKSCRSRQELSNEYFLAKFGFDTEENEPSKVCLNLFESFFNSLWCEGFAPQTAKHVETASKIGNSWRTFAEILEFERCKSM